MGNIAGNLKYLRKKKGLTQQQLADTLNVKRPVIGAYEEARAEPKTELLKEIAIFFSITVDELVSKELSDRYFEQKKKQAEQEQFNIGKQLKVLSITVDKEDRENIELVPAKASAGYLNGYADPEFISELPRFHLPMLKGGTFRAFELKGDSMLPLLPGTIVIAEYLDNWNQAKSGATYILLTKNDGVVYKRLQNKLREQKAFRLISDNKAYDPYNVPAEDVLEIWKAKAYISTVFPEPGEEPSLGKLTEMVQHLQRSVTGLKKEKEN